MSAVAELEKKYARKPIRGDIHTEQNLKVLLDDLLNEYLAARGCRRNYLYIDLGNAAGVVCVLLAALTTYLSVMYKFNDVHVPLLAAVAAYFAVNTCSTLVGFCGGSAFRYAGFSLASSTVARTSYELRRYDDRFRNPLRYVKRLPDLFDDAGCLDHALFLKDMEEFFNKRDN
ncbi:signal peptidase complex subunit 2 [Pancytospora philotis]|nr:signal peptidase complex subunit 2 [Pancytospora philotis]